MKPQFRFDCLFLIETFNELNRKYQMFLNNNDRRHKSNSQYLPMGNGSFLMKEFSKKIRESK